MASLSYNSGNQESFLVRYWDRSGEFVKQTTQVVYCKKKSEHEAAAEFCMRMFNINKSDIISVKYQ